MLIWGMALSQEMRLWKEGVPVMPRILVSSRCAVAIMSSLSWRAGAGFLVPPSMTLMAMWSAGARWCCGKRVEVKRAPSMSVFSGRLASIPKPSSGWFTWLRW